MHKKTFEVVEFDGEIDEMLDNDSTVELLECQKEVIEKVERVYVKPASLSDFAREVTKGNRKERRAEAKRIRKAFK